VNGERTIRALGAFLGLAFIALGIAELVLRVTEGDLSLFFWLPTLWGAGILVLVGTFKSLSPAWTVGLVTVGALVGALVTVWTILAPILAITLVVLTVRRTRQPAPSSA
jgi:hypothetical protein